MKWYARMVVVYVKFLNFFLTISDQEVGLAALLVELQVVVGIVEEGLIGFPQYRHLRIASLHQIGLAQLTLPPLIQVSTHGCKPKCSIDVKV